MIVNLIDNNFVARVQMMHLKLVNASKGKAVSESELTAEQPASILDERVENGYSYMDIEAWDVREWLEPIWKAE